ncbi:MAG TPA: nuclear transport factor 2 family protein, partial [Ktedonobacterales bacterium]|nr:nuclear transport factor 2 family protein [Ktedonobacterales bacterium]
LAERRPRFNPSPAKQKELLQRFVVACSGGDLAGLTDILARDAVVWADGGGKAVTVMHPVIGAAAVARFFAGMTRQTLDEMGLRIEEVEVNGAPALALYEDDSLTTVMCFAIENDRIAAVYGVRNPDKLAFIARQLQQRP